MTIMADAEGQNAHLIPRSVGAVAPYITGLFGVPWTPAERALFAGVPQKTIDQGAGNSPQYGASIIDIETGAYNVGHVTNWMNNATDPDPTIYVNRGNEQAACVAALASPRFKGAVWLSYPGWHPGMPLPMLPAGCRYVAIQDVFAGSYDLSDVLDEKWLTGSAPTPPPATNWTEEMVQQLPVVMSGQTGAYVRRVQGLCVANGQAMAPYGIDGKFGNATKTAVETLQRAAGFTTPQIDGIVGQQTWPMLLGV